MNATTCPKCRAIMRQTALLWRFTVRQKFGADAQRAALNCARIYRDGPCWCAPVDAYRERGQS